jgi:hypothetical protein
LQSHARIVGIDRSEGVSFVHYLSIGRFAVADMPATTLLERVVAHFVPDGLAHLGAPAAPFLLLREAGDAGASAS